MALSKILYVEDDDDIRTVTVMALEMIGDFTVEAHNFGGDAIARAEAFAPDLILLDVMMPGMDGPSTLAALREKRALDHVPAVFFTAKAQPEEVARLRALGAADVLAKPFDPQVLPDALRRIWTAATA
ncbi:response regulator [Sphingoaurantiacus capsulatus]|uniref:Response regulator n=1 Tax=Sphingoaurantiacus capsulatus TaxID=1771310 RepID=A0ABV7XA13_9SPHN